MINNSEKFMFIHPPKCAGTSVRSVLRRHYKSHTGNRELEPFGMDLSSEGIKYYLSVHGTLPQFAKFINDRYSEDCFKRKEWYIFAVIRNPFDRVVSFYHHILVHGRASSLWKENSKNISSMTFNDWVCHHLEKEDLARKKTYKSMFYFNDELCIDHFIRQENIEHDSKIVFNRLGIIDYNLSHHKHDTNRVEYDYRKYYNDETKEKVSKLFEWDINYFGYKF